MMIATYLPSRLTYYVSRDTFTLMIRSFRDSKTEELFDDQDVLAFRAIERVARRKLLYLNQTRRLEDLRVPPGNRLEALRGRRKGEYSIRINDQWRVCFRWINGDVFDVEIVDYH
jgi:toxin HigB-1